MRPPSCALFSMVLPPSKVLQIEKIFRGCINIFLGYIGDRIGYKKVVMTCMIGTAIAGTCFDLTPRSSTIIQFPKLWVTQNESESQIQSIQWPICVETLTSEDCNDALEENYYFDFISNYTDCQNIENEPFFGESSIIRDIDDGTYYCNSWNENFDNETNFENLKTCSINGYDNLGNCTVVEGSHVATFWTYMGLRTVFRIFMGSCYSLLDSTGVVMADMHNSDYSQVLLISQAVAVVSPILAGLLIRDPEESDGNYLLPWK